MPTRRAITLLFTIVISISAIFGYAWHDHTLILRALVRTQKNLVDTTTMFADQVTRLTQDMAQLKNENKRLEDALAEATSTNSTLSTTLDTERGRNTIFQNQINAISGTVGTLEKLSKTDRELLQKYSKVYFLNENYIPSNLSAIDPGYIFDKTKTLEIHTNVKPFLEKLLAQATADGQPLALISAYRSFGTQATLKSIYMVTYGAGTANKFSAEQGFSEHQLGTTIDFTTPTLGAGFSKFESASAYQWLINNAYKYGFIISYPKANKFYQFEPWHWRFVGVSLATKLHDNNQFFYNLDQREIDIYLADIFDPI